jgi:hypothetical protein
VLIIIIIIIKKIKIYIHNVIATYKWQIYETTSTGTQVMNCNPGAQYRVISGAL